MMKPGTPLEQPGGVDPPRKNLVETNTDPSPEKSKEIIIEPQFYLLHGNCISSKNPLSGLFGIIKVPKVLDNVEGKCVDPELSEISSSSIDGNLNSNFFYFKTKSVGDPIEYMLEKKSFFLTQKGVAFEWEGKRISHGITDIFACFTIPIMSNEQDYLKKRD